MGNRQALFTESQEMVPRVSLNQSHAPLVISEDEQSYLPRTIAVPHVKISSHLLPESFTIKDANTFSFIFDSLFDCEIIISTKNFGTEAKNPQNTVKQFKVRKGLNQDFTGWQLDFSTGASDNLLENIREKELKVKMKCDMPIPHCEISHVSFRKVNEVYTGKVRSQQLEYNGKVYELKELYGGSQQEDRNECAVCLFNKRDTVIIPCYHMCLCASCGNMLRVQSTKKCPICRCGNFYLEAEALMKICPE